MDRFEQFSDEPAKPELSVSGYGDVFEMIGEIGASDESIVDMLVDIIANEPVPDPSNPEAVNAFRTKMRLIEARMNELLARSDALLELKEKIDSKINELNPE